MPRGSCGAVAWLAPASRRVLLGPAAFSLAGLDPCLLDGVDLQETVELGLVAPGAVVVVVVHLPGGRVDDNRIGPVRSRTMSPVASPLKSCAVPWSGGGSSRRRQAALTAAWSRTSVLMVTMWDKT
jgi:hypothetical protein